MNNKLTVKQNNKGFTLVEMITTFALLGIFMVAAARVISYTIGIYYAAKGNSYGYEVSYMISNKIRGQLENANDNNSFVIADKTTSFPTVSDDGESIKFVDKTGSIVEASVNDEGYFVLSYDEVVGRTEEDSYKAVDWFFDKKAYMGYTIEDIRFENPGEDYPKNVVRMNMTLHSPQYGDFETSYYIKCYNVEQVDYL